MIGDYSDAWSPLLEFSTPVGTGSIGYDNEEWPALWKERIRKEMRLAKETYGGYFTYLRRVQYQ